MICLCNTIVKKYQLTQTKNWWRKLLHFCMITNIAFSSFTLLYLFIINNINSIKYASNLLFTSNFTFCYLSVLTHVLNHTCVCLPPLCYSLPTQRGNHYLNLYSTTNMPLLKVENNYCKTFWHKFVWHLKKNINI